MAFFVDKEGQNATMVLPYINSVTSRCGEIY